MRRLIVAILATMALLVGSVSSIVAQEVLEPGVIVDGEITDETTEVTYEYDGIEGEIIVIQLAPVDVLADYDRPAIVLADSDGNEIVRREGFGATTLVWELAADGVYTIVATRADEESVGDYTLTVLSPEELAPGDIVEGEIDAETAVYYVYREDSDFVVSYERDGDFAPELSVNTIATDITPGSLNVEGNIGGASLTQGTMGVFSGDSVYVLKLEQALLDFNFGNPTADYVIEIIEP